MDMAIKLNQEEHVPKINLTYAYLYNLLGDPKKAIEYGLIAAEGFEKNNIKEVNIQSVYAWIEIGRIFEDEEQYDKALFYYNKALNKAKTSDKDWYLRPAIINIATIYVKQKRLDDARVLYKDAVQMNRQNSGVEYKIWGLSGLGDIATIEKDYNKAIACFKEGLGLAEAYNMKTNIDNCFCRTGHAYLLNKQYDSAEIYLQKGLQYAKESEGWKTINESYEYLSELFEKQNKYKEALQYAHLYKETSDSIYNKGKLTIINNLELLYQTNQKEKEIIRLKANNTEKELQLVKRNRLLWITVITIGALLIIFLIYLRNSKYNRMIVKQQQLIQDQKINSLEQEQKVVVLKSMLAGQDNERTRIAKDLHDGLSGLFSTIKMHLSTLQHENEYLKSRMNFLKKVITW